MVKEQCAWNVKNFYLSVKDFHVMKKKLIFASAFLGVEVGPGPHDS